MGFERKVLFVSSAGTSGLLSIRTNPKEERIAKVAEKQARLQEHMLKEQRQRANNR